MAENLYELFIHIDNSTSVNLYALIGSTGILLIDSGYSSTTDLVTEELKKITDKPVEYLINTHSNGDHTGGNAQIGANARIIAHLETRRQLVKESQLPLEGLPEITFRDSLTIWFNNEEELKAASICWRRTLRF